VSWLRTQRTSDAGIRNISRLLYPLPAGHLDLLKKFSGRINLAPAVPSQLRAGAALGISVPDPGDLDWLSILLVRNPYRIPLITDLGLGEAETIALGLEHQGSRTRNRKSQDQL
jgi:predicted nucleic acid-binding protein